MSRAVQSKELNQLLALRHKLLLSTVPTQVVSQAPIVSFWLFRTRNIFPEQLKQAALAYDSHLRHPSEQVRH
jgi:hypothetical protein